MKMSALFDLSGKVAVVTGGNGGIGRGIAIGLAEAGASVAIFGRNDDKNQHVLSELNAIGVPSIAVKIDLTDRAAAATALRRVESELGNISILVNNAGNVSLSGGILHEKAEDWDNVIETQLNAVFLLSKLHRPSGIHRLPALGRHQSAHLPADTKRKHRGPAPHPHLEPWHCPRGRLEHRHLHRRFADQRLHQHRAPKLLHRADLHHTAHQ
jgi:NAD(P)-dependent dehydrogenase (short-subunit alcohol dehydrogenase family)